MLKLFKSVKIVSSCDLLSNVLKTSLQKSNKLLLMYYIFVGEITKFIENNMFKQFGWRAHYRNISSILYLHSLPDLCIGIIM